MPLEHLSQRTGDHDTPDGDETWRSSHAQTQKHTKKTVQAVHPGGWMHIHPMYVEYLCKKKQATLRAIFSTV